MDDKPIKSLDITLQSTDTLPVPTSPIPRRKKSVQQSNGHTNGNGTATSSVVVENGSSGKKRGAAEAFDSDSPTSKRSKVVSNGTDNDVIVLDDTTDGAILIDDD